MTTLLNGFVIGDDGRVVVAENAPTAYWQTKPVNLTAMNSCGKVDATPISFSNGQGFDSAGLLAFVEVSITPLATPIRFVGGMPYDDSGRLVCDSVAPVAVLRNGLPFAASGALCINSGAAPVDTFHILTESGDPILTESGAYLII